jgi:hypothetical protein
MRDCDLALLVVFGVQAALFGGGSVFSFVVGQHGWGVGQAVMCGLCVLAAAAAWALHRLGRGGPADDGDPDGIDELQFGGGRGNGDWRTALSDPLLPVGE